MTSAPTPLMWWTGKKMTVARWPCAIKQRLLVIFLKSNCLLGRWTIFAGVSVVTEVAQRKGSNKYGGVKTLSFVRVTGVCGPSAGREAAASAASGAAHQRVEPPPRPGGQPARARLDVIQCVVASPLFYLPACPGGRGERGPAEEPEQAEQKHEQNQTR